MYSNFKKELVTDKRDTVLSRFNSIMKDYVPALERAGFSIPTQNYPEAKELLITLEEILERFYEEAFLEVNETIKDFPDLISPDFVSCENYMKTFINCGVRKLLTEYAPAFKERSKIVRPKLDRKKIENMLERYNEPRAKVLSGRRLSLDELQAYEKLTKEFSPKGRLNTGKTFYPKESKPIYINDNEPIPYEPEKNPEVKKQQFISPPSHMPPKKGEAIYKKVMNQAVSSTQVVSTNPSASDTKISNHTLNEANWGQALPREDYSFMWGNVGIDTWQPRFKVNLAPNFDEPIKDKEEPKL